MEDPFTWQAIYENGETVHQIHPETKEKFSYEDIDRDRLAAFRIMQGAVPIYVVNFDGDGHSLVWRRRVEEQFNNDPVYAHIVAKKNRFATLIFQNKQIVTTNNFDENDAWLYPPVERKFEK